jgi:2-phosphosulfolactate phosphatase
LEVLDPYPPGTAIVAVDVIRSTTTAITAVSGGRQCFVVPSLEAATRRRATLDGAFMVGELGGNMPFGFDATNSPVAVAQLGHLQRPLILLSSSGTRLMTEASIATDRAYVACLRNWTSQARALVALPVENVVLLGAGTRGEFREEDQICCAWIAAALLSAGAETDDQTRQLVTRWSSAPVSSIADGSSGSYLQRSGQLHDLEFILTHVDDVDAVFMMRGDEVCIAQSATDQPPTIPSSF